MAGENDGAQALFHKLSTKIKNGKPAAKERKEFVDECRESDEPLLRDLAKRMDNPTVTTD
jgi:hypothetical protein